MSDEGLVDVELKVEAGFWTVVFIVEGKPIPLTVRKGASLAELASGLLTVSDAVDALDVEGSGLNELSRAGSLM